MTPTTTAGDPMRRRSMLVAACGTVVEWYDFSIYFYVASTLTQEFFGGDGRSLLLTLGVGAAGFGFRPLGAVVFGHLADRIGRRRVLIISAAVMAVAMCGVAVMPSHNLAGMWGGLGMVVFRCLAGFSVGAEYTGIMVFLMESARRRHRGFAASWAAANSEVGALLAVGIGAALANTLSPQDMRVWGWRVLFGVGGLLAAAMIPLRRLLRETDTFTRVRADETPVRSGSPVRRVLVDQPRAVLIAFLISTVGSVTYFLNITYVPTYLERSAHFANAGSLAMGSIAAVAAIVVTPFIGLLSDRFGRRATMAAVLGVLLITTVPVYAALSGGGAMFGAAFLALPAAAWSAAAAATIPEQFAAAGRFSGMAIGYNVATVLFGGLSPLIATSLIGATGSALAPALYSTAILIVAGVPILLWTRDMAVRPLAELDKPAEPALAMESADS